MSTMMAMALLQKVQEQEMMLSPASSAIPTAGCSQGAASFAQERIWLDEKIYHDPAISPAMHNFVLPLVIKHGSMSIKRIRSAVVAVLEQHEILRTAIYFDENRNILVQAVQSVDNNDAYSFEITANDIQSPDEITDLLRNESVKHFAELEHGLVIRCHLVKMGSDDDMDKLYPQDLVIFIFHGVAFDYNSISPFLVAFTKAYDQMEVDVERLQYINFSLYEHQQFVNIAEDSQIRRAQQFWSTMMDDYSLDAYYSTPFTRPFDTKKRSGEGHSTSFILDSTLVKAQMEFVSLHNVSMFHTALACFFLFIYELNDGTISDLCVTCPTENRSFVDTKRMIGTFANLLPYRIKINANESFINLVQRICELGMDILNHCQLPYQQIIRDNKELCSNKIPLHFQYEEIHSSSTSETKSIGKTNDAALSLYTEQPGLHGNGTASHDMNIRMIHNQSSQTTYCIFECSADCYDEVTVSNVGRYFQNLLLHIFTENTKTIGFDPIFEKIGNLSLLPMNVETLSYINESLRHFSEIKPASYAQHRIWHDEERRLHLDGPQLTTYNMAFCYRLSADHTLSVQQLRYALDLVVDKHQSLRTSFIFDTTKNILTQRIVDQQNHENNRFSIVESIYETDEQLDEIIHNETHNPHIFDLAQGLVFRWHLVRYKQVSIDDLISDNDIIIFNFHHASFDYPSMKIFLHDLHQAYTTSQLLNDDSTSGLRYLDYAVIEQHMPMIGAIIQHPQKLAVELDEQSLTYCEVLYYVQILSLTLLNEYHVIPGEIVCQCVERSLSMVIGIMGIEMAGGVYCPLSPRDPQHRLYTLIQQTRSRLVLVQWLTKMKFNNDILLIDIQSMLLNNEAKNDVNVDQLSSITVTPNNIAYIIFTSGSTGIPKAIARCSFDIHVQEIFGALMHGATLVMLHPRGTIDFDYLSNIVQMKQITYILMVPSLLRSFFTLAAQSDKTAVSKYFRSLCTGGESVSVQLSTLIANNSVSEYNVWNYYGPAEITITCTLHLIDVKANPKSIPIGRSLPNYRCIILSEFLQLASVNQEGELFVGGVGLFAGYLGRDDLTAKALVEIDEQLFYRTGDLVTIDNNGLFYHRGRKDHQIKLRGQRIELSEIERCLLKITSISACVVMKWNDDYLVAYVQSSHVNEQQLRQHCQSYLPPHVVPSIFAILEKFPLNANGKIDRKRLPLPHYSSSTIPSLSELDTPVNQVEKNVYDIWCQVLECNGQHISTTANFFTIGGHSRLFIELYHRYQTIFGFDSRTLAIGPFLEQPTIQQHAKLLKAVTTDDMRREQWSTLYIYQGMASFAQERIFLDEQIRFSYKHIFYNNFVALRVTEGVLSIKRVLQALQLVLKKHEILRTSLVFNNNDSTLQQYVTDNHKTFTFLDQQNFESDNELQNIIYRTVINPDLFDLSSGRVFSCQMFQQQKTTHETAHTDFLEKSGVLVLYFHHAAVDGSSIPILLNDFYNAYSNNMTVSLDEQSLKYIDYAVYERIMDMTLSRSFWYSQLERFNLKRVLKLPVDRHRSSAVQRSNLASVAQISFDKELSMMFLNYASLHQITPFQLSLTIFYVFLFKLTHEETDLCIASLNANRYRSELENMIGMFVSTLPYCVQLNSHLSFDELVKHVREKCLSILEHSHYPLQYILADFRLNQLDIPFLDIVFNFLPDSINTDRYSIGDVWLEEVPIEESNEIAQFDFLTTFLYNPTSDDHKLSSPASFAQARIWLDERIRFDPDKPQVAIYNMPFVYHLQSGHTISVKQLHQALRLTVNKHPSLHTSLHFDTQKNLLMQRVTTHEHKNNNNNLFSIIETIYETDEQLNEILHDERRNPHLFDLAQGLVFRCHIIYYKQISSNDLLSDHDLLIFNFHHALFDFPSMEVFHHDLNQAYTTSQLLYDDNTHLRYLDYAVIEQEMSMTGASMFWLDALHDCKLDQSLSLPFDRYRLSDEHRTGRGTSISFDFGQDLSHHFLSHASSNNISMEQLALATYYVFLFKLTNGEKDLCIGINTHGRYRDELSSIIGMFVNAIPLRCQLDPHLSFHKLTKHVQDTMINCIRYSYFPLQRILNQHPNISNPVFLDTSFDFVSTMKRDEKNEIMIGDSRLSLLPFSIKISEDEIMSKFDFILSFQHDLNLNEISCTIDASVDLFNPETICTIAQRLRTMLHQSSAWIIDNEINKPVFELSLILSNEQYLMQSLNNTQISFSSSPVTCIHHGFVYQVMKHPQKLAVELDEQSLTYCELLYYVQVLSCTLLKEYDVLPGEIVCQCVERSLSMVVGIMAIEMAGGVYCPLSPRDPQHRLHTLTQQTQSRLVLVHHITKTKFDDYIVPVDIDLILNINDIDKKGLSSVITKDEEIAYIIFTSGSTGTPKAVQVRHKNFIDSMHSLTYINSFNKGDTVVQMTRCSFDIHVQEILGTLLFGCTVIMLHPGGMTDFDYLSNVLQKKQITYLSTVPSLLHSFFIFIEHNKKVHAAIYLRSLCSGGGSFSVPLIDLIVKSGMKNCIVWNLYGPAEITITCTGHRVNATNGIQSIAIGRPLSNYRCMILTEYLQSSVIGQEGELLVGGVGVFAGYLGRDDLTAKALVEIDGQLFYRTGDLVRIDNNGLLHYQGRKDHQIKLHGQRIELGEIERCLLNITSISACVVVKWNDDYLVTYVQSSNINEEELRQHCESHLPPHMIPSIFIILDKLPLNPNGKIDRKQLPSPDFSLSTLLSSDKSDTPLNQFEEHILTIWCQVLHSNEQNHISRTTSFFSVGGHSLLFIELYHHYQSVFNFDAHIISIGP
ncbi:unnamed protein product, partial [Adineta steineri]